jgi:hypothetical protein
MIESGDIVFQFGGKADAMDAVFGLESANRTAYLRDLSDMRAGETVLDVDEILWFRPVARVEIMRHVTGFVLDEIIFRIESVLLYDRTRVGDKALPLVLRHVKIEGLEKPTI